MFKSDIVAGIVAIVFTVAGGFIAAAPIIDPGYLHPLALVLTGLGAAVAGVAMAGFILAQNALDRSAARNYAAGRQHAAWEAADMARRARAMESVWS